MPPPSKSCGRTRTASGIASTPSCPTWPSQVSAGIDPADVHEPGTAWKPEHHRDPDVARSKLLNRSRSAPLEVEDVEAAHEDAPGAAEAMRLAAEQL